MAQKVPDRPRGLDRRGGTAEGIGTEDQYKGRTGGGNKGVGQADNREEKGEGRQRADREGETEGGWVRRGYTPEPVYGQKCESPRLSNMSGQGIIEPRGGNMQCILVLFNTANMHSCHSPTDCSTCKSQGTHILNSNMYQKCTVPRPRAALVLWGVSSPSHVT